MSRNSLLTHSFQSINDDIPIITLRTCGSAVFYLNSLAGDFNDGNDHWLWLNFSRDLFPHFIESAQIRHCYLCKGVLEEILISTSYHHHHVPGTPNLLDRTKINRIFHCRRSENGKHGRGDDPEAAAAIVLMRPRLWGTRHGEPEKKRKPDFVIE